MNARLRTFSPGIALLAWLSIGLLLCPDISMAASATKQRPPGSDAEIAALFRNRLSRSKLSSSSRIAIEVRQGTATLTGSVTIPQHKGIATRMARSSGAVKVINSIQITTQSRSALRKPPGRDLPKPASASSAGTPSEADPPPAPPPVRRAQVRGAQTGR